MHFDFPKANSIARNMQQRTNRRRLWRAVAVSVIILVAVVTLAGAYLRRSSPHALAVIVGFGSNPISLVIALFGIGVAMRLALERPSFRKVKRFAFLAEGLVVACTIGLFLEVPHLRSIFAQTPTSDSGVASTSEHANKELLGFVGEWEYQVTDTNGAITHKGTATIEHKPEGLFIHGHRSHMLFPGERELRLIPNGGIYWASNMMCIYGVPRLLHFIYTIRLPGDQPTAPANIVQGYCVLAWKGDPATQLEGTYTLLAPGKLTGDIVFRRLE